jgi:hypothetical protein
MGLNAGKPLLSPQKRGWSSQPRVVKEPGMWSGAKRMQTAEGIGRIEHKVASPTQQLSQGANRPGKAKGSQPPQTWPRSPLHQLGLKPVEFFGSNPPF